MDKRRARELADAVGDEVETCAKVWGLMAIGVGLLWVILWYGSIALGKLVWLVGALWP